MEQQEEMSQISSSVWVPANLAWQVMSALLSFRKKWVMGKEFEGLWPLEMEADEEQRECVISGVSSGLGAWTL